MLIFIKGNFEGMGTSISGSNAFLEGYEYRGGAPLPFFPHISRDFDVTSACTLADASEYMKHTRGIHERQLVSAPLGSDSLPPLSHITLTWR